MSAAACRSGTGFLHLSIVLPKRRIASGSVVLLYFLLLWTTVVGDRGGLWSCHAELEPPLSTAFYSTWREQSSVYITVDEAGHGRRLLNRLFIVGPLNRLQRREIEAKKAEDN